MLLTENQQNDAYETEQMKVNRVKAGLLCTGYKSLLEGTLTEGLPYNSREDLVASLEVVTDSSKVTAENIVSGKFVLAAAVPMHLLKESLLEHDLSGGIPQASSLLAIWSLNMALWALSSQLFEETKQVAEECDAEDRKLILYEINELADNSRELHKKLSQDFLEASADFLPLLAPHAGEFHLLPELENLLLDYKEAHLKGGESLEKGSAFQTFVTTVKKTLEKHLEEP